MHERLRAFLASARLPVWLALFAFVAGLPALRMGWQMDDYLILSKLRGYPGWESGAIDMPSLFGLTTGDRAGMRWLLDRGLVPWWGDESLRLAFMRPLAEATHRFDEAMAPGSAAFAHLHSLGWWALLAAVVLFAHRRLMGGGWVAGLAALLWTVDDARGIPAGWVANRNALLATFFGVLALVAHDLWRRRGRALGGWLAPALLAASLLSAEAGVGACALLFAYACCLDPGEGRVRRLATLVPYGVVVVGWRLAYQLLGYGAEGSDFYIDPVRQPIAFLAALVERLPILLQGQWLFPFSELAAIVTTPWRRALMVLGTVTACALVWLFRDLLRRDRRARFYALGSVLAMVPIAAVIPGDRNLAFVGFGASGLLALALEEWRERPESVAPTRRSVLAVLAVYHLAVAPLLQQFMLQSTAQLGRPVLAAARSVPVEALDAEADVVLVSAPDVFYSVLVPVVHGLDGVELPRSIRPLSLGGPMFELRRVDERTLMASWPGGMPQGLFAGLFRSRSKPLEPGARVRLAGLEIEVLGSEGGRVGAARFRWSVPLEDPGLRWLEWRDGVFVPFTPPPVGGAVEVPAAVSPFEATFGVR